MDLMPRTEEARLTAAVEHMIDMVSDGASPTSALMKAAADLSDRAVSRVAELYNQSRTMYKLSNQADRLGSFELADPDAVVGERRKQASERARSKVATGVSTPDMFKAAAAPRGAQSRSLEKAASVAQPAEAAACADSDSEPEYALREKFSAAVHSAAEQLRSVFLGDGFHSVEALVLEKCGEQARPVLDLLWEATEAGKFRQKRATPADVSSVTLVDLLANTVSHAASVERMVDLSLRYQKKANLRKQAAKQAQKLAEPAVKQAADGKKAPVSPSGIWSTFGDAASKVDSYVKAHPSATFGRKEPAAGDAMLAAGRQLEDPTLDRSIQQIRVRAGLGDLLANDEVISGYSEDEVADAFNQVAQVAPSAVENKAVMRDLLRRALTGGVSSFDIQQAVGLSRDLDVSRAGTNSLTRGSLPSDVASQRPTLPMPQQATRDIKR